MTKPQSRSPYRDGPSEERTLTDRVRDHVTTVEVRLATAPEQVDEEVHSAALWKVFHNFGDVRREQRQRTGERALPGLREATRAFRREPSLAALVDVAAFLDERGLLTQVS